jgi:type IV pilus assembly protein PilV
MFTPTLKSTTGFSMIEMLVALVVLSIGLLGIASLQTLGQQFNYRAYLRTQATFLAYDIMDRMRANQQAALAGQYVLTEGAKPKMSKDCNKETCTHDDLAKYDVAIWYNLMTNNLPDPIIEIKVSMGTVTEYTLSFHWAEEHGDPSTAKTANRSDPQIWTIRP